MSSEQKAKKSRFRINSKALWLIVIAAATVALWQIPYGRLVLYPFTILGTWFHEMGHGLAALFLGGYFHELLIFSNGSGLASYDGDIFLGNQGRGIIALAGPLGPTIAGGFFIAASRNKTATNIMLFLLCALMVASCVLWIRTWIGIAIIGSLALIIMFFLFKSKGRAKPVLLQFLGIQACVSIYLSIDYLFSSGGTIGESSYMSDTSVAAEYLLLPVWFWAAGIISISAAAIICSIRYAYKIKPSEGFKPSEG